jgi:hypothetical protein
LSQKSANSLGKANQGIFSARRVGDTMNFQMKKGIGWVMHFIAYAMEPELKLLKNTKTLTGVFSYITDIHKLKLLICI